MEKRKESRTQEVGVGCGGERRGAWNVWGLGVGAQDEERWVRVAWAGVGVCRLTMVRQV